MEDPDVTSNCSQELHYPELPGPECVVDTNQDEIVVAILIVLLVLVTFYRLIHVWDTRQGTLVHSLQGHGGDVGVLVHFWRRTRTPLCEHRG